MEECSEIQKEISKALRFGLNRCYPKESGITNRERILKEYAQLQVVMELLSYASVLKKLSPYEEEQYKSEKLSKLKKYEMTSKELGQIKE